MDAFKLPLGIAQDLLLIQSLVGPSETPPLRIQETNVPEDVIDSSGSEPDSEDEIEAALVGKTDPDGFGYVCNCAFGPYNSMKPSSSNGTSQMYVDLCLYFRGHE